MQTKPESDVQAICGAAQVPILQREQLTLGTLVTGIAWDYVHEIQAVEGETVTFQRMPRGAHEPGHVHAYTQHGNEACACGLSRRPIARLLPEDGTTPRMFALVPQGELLVPDHYSVYLLAGGRTLMIEQEQGGASPTPTATAELPIICKAHKIWSLPQALRGLLELGPSVRADEGPEQED